MAMEYEEVYASTSKSRGARVQYRHLDDERDSVCIRCGADALVMRQDDEVVGKRVQIALVQVYLSHMQLPTQLRRQIESFFLACTNDASISSITDEFIYDHLPVALQIEISLVTNRAMVGELALLRGCSDTFVDCLSSLLRERTVESESFLFNAGDPCRELFILDSGAVEAFDNDDAADKSAAQLYEPGDSIGDIPFVFKMRHFNNARCVGKGDSALYVLTRERWLTLVKTLPLQEDVVMENVISQHLGASMGFMSARPGKSAKPKSKSDLDYDGASAAGSTATGMSKKGQSLSSIQKIIGDAKQKRVDKQSFALCAACAKGTSRR
mmetsp:Transcript_41116/g.101450  ORF Transcript_41116/g.101450 Transcript_41116/m.101450 type:complete len:326 (+) Transcript_41116:665-1642(+)